MADLEEILGELLYDLSRKAQQDKPLELDKLQTKINRLIVEAVKREQQGTIDSLLTYIADAQDRGVKAIKLSGLIDVSKGFQKQILSNNLSKEDEPR